MVLELCTRDLARAALVSKDWLPIARSNLYHISKITRCLFGLLCTSDFFGCTFTFEPGLLVVFSTVFSSTSGFRCCPC
ncbi:uncharacterized protein PHACADRAFT_266242 [Phanerochaete carnosa HHB-10118-sp]|uniref:F-box domain-containing protein n=1 Tax=Phanerochaete carnosa (strain HHB-10118-sp) TaxID=650164 RepID=K5UGN1_PHACS|nr:uncharacterized protein PHACADRAFT_266242 [Phanerochaete carnosa HHB-10118-sp]EKM48636.1 hypothetical protein PHACADRAFT_266242 [Phanerochaete carnosa HHB-10118-sp]